MSISIKGLLPLMNASSNVRNLEIANKVATTATLFRKYFPDASVNFSPWDKANDRDWFDTLDFSFHFPGWSPSIECRAVLLQLRIENNCENGVPKLLGIITVSYTHLTLPTKRIV